MAVIGGSGVVGRAAAEQFAADGADVIAVSRHPPHLDGVVPVALDLADHRASAEAIAGPVFAGTTHIVYAATQESTDLTSGWLDRALMNRNLAMFQAAIDPLLDHHGSTLQHVSLLQGAKAYALHVGHTPMPAKERAPRVEHDNFYFLQEDHLRSLATGASWSWTILRPQVVYGESIGSPMNLLPAIGAYAAMERALDRPLSFPGGGRSVQEAVDARLLARVLVWAAQAGEAKHEVFNVTNGDVFDWHDVWPVIAESLGMEVDEPEPQRLSETMPPRRDEWARVVERHALLAPSSLEAFVGSSWHYADILFGSLGGRSVPALLSTIKLRQAGFGDCIDTEDMFRYWFARFEHARLLPPH